MKASDLLVQCLEEEGIEYIFGVPGEEKCRLHDIAGAVQENTLHPDPTRTGSRLHGRNLRPTDW